MYIIWGWGWGLCSGLILVACTQPGVCLARSVGMARMAPRTWLITDQRSDCLDARAGSVAQGDRRGFDVIDRSHQAQKLIIHHVCVTRNIHPNVFCMSRIKLILTA